MASCGHSEVLSQVLLIEAATWAVMDATVDYRVLSAQSMTPPVPPMKTTSTAA